MSDTLDEIRERFDAIIPGPWRWFGNTATDQIFLGTVDRGRLYIASVGTRAEERVFDHDATEGYTLEEARDQRRVLSWCPVHGDPEFPDEGADRQTHCRCDEIREFLSGTMDQEEGRRDLLRGIHTWLTRHISVHPDLRFPVRDPRSPGDTTWDAERKRQGGFMRSYRDCGPKYEVLGYRSIIGWEADQGGVQNAREALYREDFVGIDQPEATFIERAPEDVEYLLKRLTLAEQALASMQTFASWAMHSQALQGTADAQARAARDLLAWEELCD